MRLYWEANSGTSLNVVSTISLIEAGNATRLDHTSYATLGGVYLEKEQAELQDLGWFTSVRRNCMIFKVGYGRMISDWQ